MRLESPLALILLILLPLLLRGNLWQRTAVSFSSSVPLKKLPTSLKSKSADLILSSLKIIAFVALVLALARPQYGNQIIESETSGKDIVLVLDISGSMQALDFKLEKENVSRLSALKEVVKNFIDNRRGDRIGIVVFASQSFTQCPLTHDTELLKRYVDALEVGMAGENTAIGDGIAVALKRIKDIEAESKVIVLVSDGDDTASRLAPSLAAESAAKLGVKIHVIGIGGAGPAPMPMRDVFGRQIVRRFNMSFDEGLLREIAKKTNGQYFFAKDTEKLREIYSEIDQLEERKDLVKSYVEYEEKYFPFLLIGLITFFVHELLSCTILHRFP